LQQDPNKRDKFRARPAQIRGKQLPSGGSSAPDHNNAGKGNSAGQQQGSGNGGFTPMAMSRENSMDDLRAAGMRPRTGLAAQMNESDRAKSFGDSRGQSGQSSPYASRRGSSEDIGAVLSPDQQRHKLPPNKSSDLLVPPGQLPSQQVGQGSMTYNNLSHSPGPNGNGAGHSRVNGDNIDDEKSISAVSGQQPRYTYA
jgi:hypothetical protein